MSTREQRIAKLPRWARAAIATRCAKRFVELYGSDRPEPAFSRVAVAEAVKLAESACAAGGAEFTILQVEDRLFDHYDIEALQISLAGATEAADNTLTDLQEDSDVEQHVRRTLVAVMLASLAFRAAFPADGVPTNVDEVLAAIKWSIDGEPETEALIKSDLGVAEKWASAGMRNDESPVSLLIFGGLWPFGRPPSWPPSKLTFRPRARIIRTIGDRLISGPEAAVIELVKNSYDADASTVRVAFIPPFGLGAGEIIFADDGHGMSRSDIEQKWMEPATSDKGDRKSSAGGRPLLGSKGIGRFAAARLGRFLHLTSTADVHVLPADLFDIGITRQSTVIPKIDWNLFDESKYLDDVSFDVETKAVTSPLGTTLRISSLRDEWSAQQLVNLYQELRRLVSPIQDASRKPFRIFLDLSRCFEANSGFEGADILAEAGGVVAMDSSDKLDAFEILPFPLLDACDYAVDGVFDERGRFTGSMAIRRAGLEPESIDIVVAPRLDEAEEPCGVVLVKLNIFDRDAASVRQTVEKAGLGSIGIRNARKLLDNIAGVAIYREGFRVRPYGDGENDWLTLDAKRVQNPSMKIGRNQVAGVIQVDDEISSNLIERSSREGLEENGSFRRLQNLILSLLAEVVEPRRRSFRINAGLDSREKTSFRDAIETAQMDWSKALVAQLPVDQRDAAEALVSRETDKLTSYLRRLEDRTAQLEARVTLGLIIGEVMHQGNTPLSFVEAETGRLLRWLPSICNGSNESRENLVEVPRILNGMKASGAVLRTLFNALSPLSGARRGDSAAIDVRKVIDNTLYLFNTKIKSAGVTILISPEVSDQVAMGYADDLATALTNLVDNAIFWLKHHDVRKPRISFAARIDPADKVVLEVSDNGVGIPEEFLQDVFDVGFSLKPNGTGLGLSIARESISRSGGELSVSDSAEGTCFVITLPKAAKEQ